MRRIASDRDGVESLNDGTLWLRNVCAWGDLPANSIRLILRCASMDTAQATEQAAPMEDDGPAATDLEVDSAGPTMQQGDSNAPPPPPADSEGGGLCPICQHGLGPRPTYRWP
eukprot:2390556-Lingulodinium_polyedra.AAC.1